MSFVIAFLAVIGTTSVSVKNLCDVNEAALNYAAPQVQVQVHENQISAVTSTNEPILVPGGKTYFQETDLVPSLQIFPARNGADLKITYRNTFPDARSLGKIVLKGFRLGESIRYLDFRHTQEWVSVDISAGNYFSPAWKYPIDLYSPVMAASGSNYIVGASLQYSLEKYDHEIRTFLWSKVQDGAQEVNLEFRMNEVLIPPGATRIYILSFRVLSPNTDWIYSLVPYRNFFRQQYGRILMTRDPRPVAGPSAANSVRLSEFNTHGFGPASLRPDVHGYRPWADQIKSYSSMGFTRVMFWAPTGMFFTYRENNYPFPFMTHMKDIPLMESTKAELASIPSPNYQMGYWWGRSNQVMRGWDVEEFEILDPQNPSHVEAAFAELDRVVSLGGTMVGLDAFSKLSPKKQLVWLNKMRARAPTIKFITEPSNSDYIHVHVPTFYLSKDIHSENRLADFLVPGHESWAQVPGPSGTTETEIRLEARRVARLGFAPVLMKTISVGPEENAAESWNVSVPKSLRDPCYSYGSGSQ